jgi:hypothetical protein
LATVRSAACCAARFPPGLLRLRVVKTRSGSFRAYVSFGQLRTLNYRETRARMRPPTWCELGAPANDDCRGSTFSNENASQICEVLPRVFAAAFCFLHVQEAARPVTKRAASDPPARTGARPGANAQRRACGRVFTWRTALAMECTVRASKRLCAVRSGNPEWCL